MSNTKLIKVCGMRHGDNIKEVEGLNVDFLGMIFYPKSPRFLSRMPDYLPEPSKRVGVFVNESYEYICELATRYSLAYIQLHGTESPGLCSRLKENGKKIIKAFSVSDKNDLSSVSDYERMCDYFIFDTKSTGHGGSGQQFDWTILDRYHGTTPFLLSGGIGLHNLKEVVAFRHDQLAGYDLNSRFEESPGNKNVEKIRQFMDGMHLKE